MIAPSTDITLYKTSIEIDETNQLRFNTWNDQISYFNSCPKLYLENATYQRKDNVIRYPNNGISYDELLRYNYCSYKNEAYSNKTFFAFIKSMRYINDGMTEIEIETDVWQTWCFDLIYHDCFVEREHVSNDTFGKHTVPEGLETGEYMYQPNSYASGSTGGWDTIVNNCRVVFAMSSDGINIALPQEDRQYAGVFSGLRYYAMKTYTDAQKYIEWLQRQAGGVIDGLYAMFLAPDSLLGITETTTWWNEPSDDPQWEMIEVPFSSGPVSMGNCYVYDQRKCGLNYRPKNNKTLCYPYRYITVSNNAGQTNQYRYEYFKENTYANSYYCGFGVDGALSIGCSIKLYPSLYNKPEVVTEGSLGHNYLEGLDCYKLPTVSWVTDPFLNWISGNAVNLVGSTVAQTASVAAGIALSASNPVVGVGLVASGIGGALGTLKQGVEHSLEPNTAHGGANQGELLFKRGFSCYCMSIRDEYAKIVDDFFSTYGYKVNSIKIPNLHSRTNWNYIKTVDCNVTANNNANVPQEDLLKVRSLFNNGITLWHNPSTFMDYSQSNNII